MSLNFSNIKLKKVKNVPASSQQQKEKFNLKPIKSDEYNETRQEELSNVLSSVKLKKANKITQDAANMMNLPILDKMDRKQSINASDGSNQSITKSNLSFIEERINKNKMKYNLNIPESDLDPVSQLNNKLKQRRQSMISPNAKNWNLEKILSKRNSVLSDHIVDWPALHAIEKENAKKYWIKQLEYSLNTQCNVLSLTAKLFYGSDSCHVNNLDIAWFKDNCNISSSPKYTIEKMENGWQKLKVNFFSLNDAGVYCCKIEGCQTKCIVDLERKVEKIVNVVDEKMIIPELPKWIKFPLSGPIKQYKISKNRFDAAQYFDVDESPEFLKIKLKSFETSQQGYYKVKIDYNSGKHEYFDFTLNESGQQKTKIKTECKKKDGKLKLTATVNNLNVDEIVVYSKSKHSNDYTEILCIKMDKTNLTTEFDILKKLNVDFEEIYISTRDYFQESEKQLVSIFDDSIDSELSCDSSVLDQDDERYNKETEDCGDKMKWKHVQSYPAPTVLETEQESVKIACKLKSFYSEDIKANFNLKYINRLDKTTNITRLIPYNEIVKSNCNACHSIVYNLVPTHEYELNLVYEKEFDRENDKYYTPASITSDRIFSAPVLIPKRPETEDYLWITSVTPNEIKLQVGDMLDIQMRVSSSSKILDYKWTKDEKMLIHEDDIIFYENGNNYQIKKILCSKEDSGMYSLHTTNMDMYKSYNVNVLIGESPKINFINYPKHVVQDEMLLFYILKNSHFSIEANITGIPNPSIEWFRNDENITKSDNLKIKSFSMSCWNNFKIKHVVNNTDVGEYKVLASNRFGQIEKKFKLIFLKIAFDMSNLKCNIVQENCAYLTWDVNYKHLKEFEFNEFDLNFIIKLCKNCTCKEDEHTWCIAKSTGLTSVKIENLESNVKYSFQVECQNEWAIIQLNLCTNIIKITTESTLVKSKTRNNFLNDLFTKKRYSINNEPMSFDYKKYSYGEHRRLSQFQSHSDGKFEKLYEICEKFDDNDSVSLYRIKDKMSGKNFLAKFYHFDISSKSETLRNDFKNYVKINEICQNNKNMIQLHDHYLDAEFGVLIMEMMTGPTFHSMINGLETCDEGNVSKFAKDMLESISLLHENGIAHLDLNEYYFAAQTIECDRLKMIDSYNSFKIDNEVSKFSLKRNALMNNKSIGFYTDIFLFGIVLKSIFLKLYNISRSLSIEDQLNSLESKLSFDGFDFICNVLQKDHKKIPTIHQALSHKWITQIPLLKSSKTNFGKNHMLGFKESFDYNLRNQKDLVDITFDNREYAPKFIEELKNIRVDNGSSVVLRCKVRSISSPSVFWYKKINKEILISGFKYIIKSCRLTHEIRISRCGVEDDDVYMIVIENSFGSITSSAKVTVNSKRILNFDRRQSLFNPVLPKLDTFKMSKDLEDLNLPIIEIKKCKFAFGLRDRRIVCGSELKLLCTVDNFERNDDIVWKHNGVKVNSNFKTNYDITNSVGICSCTISSTSYENNGMYNCMIMKKNCIIAETSCNVVIL
ncbi:hypothetical protein A3Q56_01061 [Intoshia linei]|uniref:Uncharacterized protein n=1 Tax=Intoshia linei TaxID=1819745 RepID=A0A177BAI1_9BILA|nr:hypothetical protein A3Q56_01061 [Intoshia linei]